MRKILSIIEGHGEKEAVPTLLRRLLKHLGLEPADTSQVTRIKRHRLVKEGELERAIELAGRRTSAEDAILVLLDADDDPACTLGPGLLERARKARPDRRVGIVIANREFEAWFAAAVKSLRGYRDLDENAAPPPDPEAIRDVKGWLTRLLPPGSPYSPTIDQGPMVQRLDLDVARQGAPSFDKLCRELQRLLS